MFVQAAQRALDDAPVRQRGLKTKRVIRKQRQTAGKGEDAPHALAAATSGAQSAGVATRPSQEGSGGRHAPATACRRGQRLFSQQGAPHYVAQAAAATARHRPAWPLEAPLSDEGAWEKKQLPQERGAAAASSGMTRSRSLSSLRQRTGVSIQSGWVCNAGLVWWIGLGNG